MYRFSRSCEHFIPPGALMSPRGTPKRYLLHPRSDICFIRGAILLTRGAFKGFLQGAFEALSRRFGLPQGGLAAQLASGLLEAPWGLSREAFSRLCQSPWALSSKHFSLLLRRFYHYLFQFFGGKISSTDFNPKSSQKKVAKTPNKKETVVAQATTVSFFALSHHRFRGGRRKSRKNGRGCEILCLFVWCLVF